MIFIQKVLYVFIAIFACAIILYFLFRGFIKLLGDKRKAFRLSCIFLVLYTISLFVLAFFVEGLLSNLLIIVAGSQVAPSLIVLNQAKKRF